LWALGCESLTVAQLDGLVEQFSGTACVVFEDFDRTAASARSFLDPLAYIFRTRAKDGSEMLIWRVSRSQEPKPNPLSLLRPHRLRKFLACRGWIAFCPKRYPRKSMRRHATVGMGWPRPLKYSTRHRKCREMRHSLVPVLRKR
jgi:hypothetical protein